MFYYGLGILFLIVLIYTTLILLSHQPRDPLPNEFFYKTNDEENLKYELPPRITPKSEFKLEIEISVIIPCYNEIDRLGTMLDESIEYLKNFESYEIIIVDDGSSDGTADFAISKAREFQLKPHVLRVVQLEKNRGKGGAVTHGLLHSRGKYSLFADADGATKFSDMNKLYEYLKQQEKPSIAIGSRAHMVNTDAVVKRSFIRNFLMYGLHTLVYIFGIRQVQDTQCGFKMFNFEAVKNIFPHMHTERWIFDVEVLLLGEIQHFNLKEIAVNWQEIEGSKVDLARDSIAMAIDLVVTRLAYMFGIYRIDS